MDFGMWCFVRGCWHKKMSDENGKTKSKASIESQMNGWRIRQIASDIEKSGYPRSDVTYELLKKLNPSVYQNISSEEKEKYHTILGNIKKQSIKKYVVRLQDMKPPVEPSEHTKKELLEHGEAKIPDLSGVGVGLLPKTPPHTPPRPPTRVTSPAKSVVLLSKSLRGMSLYGDGDDSSIESEQEIAVDSIPGSKSSPFVVWANLTYPERQTVRGLEIKLVSGVKKKKLNWIAIHARLEVATPDMLKWHGNMIKGKSNMFVIHGPSQSFFARQSDEYDHDQAAINESISETIQAVKDPLNNRELVYYKIVLGEEIVLDNRVLSEEDLVIIPEYHPMEIDDTEETGQHVTGAFVSWTIALHGTGSRYDDRDKQVLTSSQVRPVRSHT